MTKHKRKCIVIDIDDCLLDSNHIMQEAEDLDLYGDLKWDYFYNHCNDVAVIPETKRFILKCAETFDIFISTARNEKYREATEDKLFYEHIGYDKMYMRADNDFRPAYMVKKDHLIEIMDNYEIVAFIDDDLQNCEMAKDLGILSLRVV